MQWMSEDMKGTFQELLNLYSSSFICAMWRITKYTLTLRKESGIKYFFRQFHSITPYYRFVSNGKDRILQRTFLERE